jgi:hypothetical protein
MELLQLKKYYITVNKIYKSYYILAVTVYDS